MLYFSGANYDGYERAEFTYMQYSEPGPCSVEHIMFQVDFLVPLPFSSQSLN